MPFYPTLHAAHPLSGSFSSSIIILDSDGIVQSFVLIATAIRLRGIPSASGSSVTRIHLDWNKNPSFLSHKTILE